MELLNMADDNLREIICLQDQQTVVQLSRVCWRLNILVKQCIPKLIETTFLFPKTWAAYYYARSGKVLNLQELQIIKVVDLNWCLKGACETRHPMIAKIALSKGATAYQVAFSAACKNHDVEIMNLLLTKVTSCEHCYRPMSEHLPKIRRRIRWKKGFKALTPLNYSRILNF
jgi:hypothetical protein